MPTEQIYVVEVIVHKIELEPNFKINDINNLSLGFKFANRVNFDIDTQNFTAPEIEANSNDKKIIMNYGKTCLFTCKPSILRQLLQTDPFYITLYDGNITCGTKDVFWKKEFADMVKFFESLGIVKSCTMEDWYPLINDKKYVTARVNVFVRLSCFGSNVQTMFQIKKNENRLDYIFRQRNASRTFQVQKHDDERCQPLVAPLYSAITDARGVDSQINMKENASLTQVFERGSVSQKLSTYQPPDVEEGINLDYDALSMCFKPSEHKFFDFLNLISADVQTHARGTCVTIPKNHLGRAQSLLHSFAGDMYQRKKQEEEKDNPLEMTADKIGRRLCGNKDCPAVKKFKEYGIGPLATGRGLGTIYGEVEPPVTYGMSHTYGTMSNYGPYGVFSRPKHEETPFVPLEEAKSETKIKTCKKKTKSATGKHCKHKKKKDADRHSKNCPLRLRGGGEGNEETQLKEDTGFLIPKSPMVECKSVMDQFDDILTAYKRALGPCGHATCPYAQNIGEETCRQSCNQPNLPPPPKSEESMSCNDVPCDFKECPYSEPNDPKKNRYPAGCGSPKCAYTKYKLGLLDEDAELEMQFLPPPLKANCGDPQCKYLKSSDLPPIHWDCPEPLPKGQCKNPNCPFLPAPLNKFQTKGVKTGPCGSPMCPYALPPPCGVPTCPFLQRECPMAAERKPKKKRKNAKSCGDDKKSEESICENPDCPYSEKNASKEISEEDDPKFKGEFQDCDNPECPSKNDKKKDKKKSKRKNKKKKDGISVCYNPDCPVKTQNGSNGSNSQSTSEHDSICSDPDCPYSELRNKKKKGPEDSGCEIEENNSLCSNPECPERKARTRKPTDPNLCPDPNCPYSQKEPKSPICEDPKCPYAQPLPSCGIPNCPYEPIPLRFFCKNPTCPSKKIDFRRKFDHKMFDPSGEGEKDGDELAGDVMAEVLKTTTVCDEDVTCETDQGNECDNPDCVMNDAETPSGKKKTKENRLDTRKGKRKRRGKFVYSIGDTYPGTKVGHKECVTPVFNVPPNMGWLWNLHTPILSMKPRRGWRPGALTKIIAQRIKAHRQSKGLGMLALPNFKKDGTQEEEGDIKVLPKPTLQIQKKEGCYYITMNPLKDPNSLVENEDPYMECTPMTFKITKNKKEDDFCYCDGEEPDNASLSSSDSELDIEFTPPAGIIHPERFKKKPNVVCCEAQYDPTDFEVQKKKPEKGKGKGKDKKEKGKGGKGGKKKK